jgi:hypothetical protein
MPSPADTPANHNRDDVADVAVLRELRVRLDDVIESLTPQDAAQLERLLQADAWQQPALLRPGGRVNDVLTVLRDVHRFETDDGRVPGGTTEQLSAHVLARVAAAGTVRDTDPLDDAGA